MILDTGMMHGKSPFLAMKFAMSLMENTCNFYYLVHMKNMKIHV